MDEFAVTRFSSRLQPDDHLHIEGGPLALGPVQPGWLSAQWAVEPVESGPNSTYFRLRNLSKPDQSLHAESGVPEAGAIGPGWLSAQWRFEPVADAAFVRILNRSPLVRFAHIESGAIDAGRVGPGWLSAHWRLETVAGTSFVRLRNRWKAEQCLSIESGRLQAEPVGPGWLSAQWSLEKVAGTAFVRLRNRWKPEQYLHIEGGKAEAGPIGNGWLSAQWLLEKVAATTFVRLRNRWEIEPELHIERGILALGAGDPQSMGAHWLAGSFRRRVIALSLFQRRLDEFINQRPTPLFRFRIDDNKFSVLVENPLKGTLEQWGDAADLGNLEIPKTGNNIRIDDLNTERVTLEMTADPVDATPEIQARVRFETKGTEIRINNAPDVDLTGAKIDVRLRFGFDAASGTLDLGSFIPLIDAAVSRAVVVGNACQVQFRGKLFRVDSGIGGDALLRALLRSKLMLEFIRTDVAVDASGLPDGLVAETIEGKIDGEILGALGDQLRDGTGQGWTPWSSVSDGASTPGAPISAVVTGPGRIALFVADPAGGVYTASRNAEGAWGSWSSVSEGSTTPGGHVTAVATGEGRIALFLADPAGGVYTASGSPESGWGSWTSVSEGSTRPGAPISAVVTVRGRIALFLADPAGGVYTASRSADGTWGPWASVSEGSTTPGGHVTAVAGGDGRIALFLADPAGGIYTSSGSREKGWAPWTPVSEGSTTPGARIEALAGGDGRITLFIADPAGGIFSASRSAGGAWGSWSPVSEGSTVPGGRINAVATVDGRIALFLADRSGAVYTASGSPGNWGPWTWVSEGRSTPGGCVAAVAVPVFERRTSPPFIGRRDRIALALADPAGGIYAGKDGAVFRPGINRRLTRLLLGGDHRLIHAHGDDRTLTLDYLLGEQLPPFAEVRRPDLERGRLAPIDHIVVLMMENRSFDHMLGYLGKHGGRTDVDGLQEADPLNPTKKNEFEGKVHLPFALSDTRFEVSPCHGYDCVAAQIDGGGAGPGGMGGFVADFAKRSGESAPECVSIEPEAIMGYYQAAQVPVYDALAREFLVCDRWFCSHPGGTFPNRFYATTGRLDRDAHGRPELNNPHGIEPNITKTIFDHLTDRGVSWRCFEHGYGFLRMFDRYRFDDTNIVGIDDREHGFFASAAAGTLPSVSFIDPDFIEVPPGNDDHAPADITAGQQLVGKVVNALIEGPLWPKTLLLVTYDEHGGFYDHVAPPPAVPVSGIDRYGVRVPALVVSPWVDRGAATNLVFDHTTILKTICRRFLGKNPPDLGERVAQANDLSGVLRTSLREDRPVIALPPGPVPVGRFDWTRWSSVSDGASTPGAPISAVVTGPGRIALFVADPAGGVYTASRSADGTGGGWQTVSEGSTTPGGHVTAVAVGEGRIALFLADPAGGVYTASGSPESGWGSWTPVSEGSTRPGAPISAVATGPGRIALFVADPAGGVYSVSRSADGTWGLWETVSEGSTTPGGHVTAVASGDGRISLFLADAAGGVYTSSGSREKGWAPWTRVSEGSTTPGAPISAVVTGPGRIALFLADPAGGIYTASRDTSGVWGPWASVSDGSTVPGGRVSAVAIGAGRIALFVADRSGAVHTASGNPDTGWGPWTPVSEGRSTPGGCVAAVVVPEFERQTSLPFISRHDRIALALAGPQGQLLASRTCPTLDVENDGDFHDRLRAARYIFFSR